MTKAKPRKNLAFVVVILGICLFGPKVSHSAKNHKLRFNKDGEFKILQVADTHFANGKESKCSDVYPDEMEFCSDFNTTDFLRRFIQAEKPDLIVFLGDNVHGRVINDYKWSMDTVFKPAIESNIPWAAVIGNFDVFLDDRKNSRRLFMEHIVGLKNTLAALRPSNLGDNEHIHGWGNYNLEVAGVEGSSLQDKSVLNLYFLDSGDYDWNAVRYNGYDYIHPSQSVWFYRTSKQLQKEFMSNPESQGRPAPGLAFFHIPLPEFENITESQMLGVRQEQIDCPNTNSGFFNTMLAAGDVKALFTGHDHVNDFCGKLSGIQLCCNGGAGYYAYGKLGWPRRGRVVNIKLDKTEEGNWGPVKSIETWKRLDDDQLTLSDPEVLWTSSTGGESDFLVNPIMSE